VSVEAAEYCEIKEPSFCIGPFGRLKGVSAVAQMLSQINTSIFAWHEKLS
jgi:hypothetical protein